jgi:hypothetical protein
MDARFSLMEITEIAVSHTIKIIIKAVRAKNVGHRMVGFIVALKIKRAGKINSSHR